MEIIDKLLSVRLAPMRDFINRANVYMEAVEHYAKGSDSIAFERTKEAVRKIDSLATRIQEAAVSIAKTTSSWPLGTVSDLYDDLNELNNSAQIVLGFMAEESYYKHSLPSILTSYVSIIHLERNNMTLLFEKYKSIGARDDDSIINHTLKDKDLDDVLMFALRSSSASSTTNKTSPATKFTSKLLFWVISKSPPGEKRRRVEEIVEQQKDIVLGSTTRTKSEHCGPVVRYGLLPTGVVAEEPPAGCTRIWRPTESPIVFDMRGLIDPVYIAENDLSISSLSGVTKKVLKKYNTTEMLTRPDQSDNQDNSNNLNHPTTDLVWRAEYSTDSSPIWETIDGGNSWRELKTVTSAANMSKGISTRPKRYHEIQSSEIMSRCLISNINYHLENFEKYKHPLTDVGRTKLVEKFTEDFLARVYAFGRHDRNSSLKSDKATEIHIKNQTELRELFVTREDVAGSITRTSQHKSAESQMTFLLRCENIATALFKEMNRRFEKVKLLDRTFTENSPDELKKILTDTFKQIMTESLNELNDSGIFDDYDSSLKNYVMTNI